MKKKLLVLLSSVIAGVGLVGATFAAWAVTDSADPLGIKISPSGISESTDGFSTMHLEWGDKTQFTNIANLGLGQTKVVTLGVKSTVHPGATGDTETGGNLAISLEDYTAAGDIVPGAPRLIDNLEVKVYKTKTDDVYSNQVEALTLDGTTISANANIATPTDGTELPLYFTVNIKSTVTSAQYNQMQKDVVYLFADWGKPTGISEVSVDILYFKADADTISASGAPRAYAYKETVVNEETVLNKNANWPGVAMEVYNTAQHIYSVALEKGKFDHVIFSYGSGSAQTADLTIPAATANTPLYNGSAWVTNSYAKDVVEPVYYLVGNVTGWDTLEEFKLTNYADGKYTFNYTVPAGGLVYKVKEVTTNTWYNYTSIDGSAENCTYNDADSIVITFSPTHSLSGDAYISAVKA